MTSLVFETPGALDLRALTLFGASAKPNAVSPLGRFGTGLKYAIAGLVRLDAPPVMHVGATTYRFRAVPVEFRDREVETIVMDDGRFSSLELPFTTALGRHWEPWMLYRELEANTKDEGGQTYISTGAFGAVCGEENFTRIVVSHPDLLAAHAAREEIFLPPEAGPAALETESLRVLDHPAAHLYYRGVRVRDLGDKPALLTYDLLEEQALTEDRTLSLTYRVHHLVAAAVAVSDDEALIERVVAAPKGSWEQEHLDWDYAWTAPSEAFKAVMARRKGAASPSALRYYVTHVPEPAPARADPFARWPRPWYKDGIDLRDNNDNRIASIADSVDDDEIDDLAKALLDAVNGFKLKDEETQF
jgi:hypothetical protein